MSLLLRVHQFKLYQVYDATPFMDDHPGGVEVMRLATGTFSPSLLPKRLVRNRSKSLGP